MKAATSFNLIEFDMEFPSKLNMFLKHGNLGNCDPKRHQCFG
jgi:hypothetical protein